MNANETVTSAFSVCFGHVRRTAASPRTEDSQRLTLAHLVRTRNGHNLLRQAASFDIHHTDTGPANVMDVELIPLCGFVHTEEWKNGCRPQNGASPTMVIRCIRRRLPG